MWCWGYLVSTNPYFQVFFISIYFQTEPSEIYLSHIPNGKRGCEGRDEENGKKRPSHLTVN
jgi:hypothetical protein